MKQRLRKLFIPHEENGFKPDFLERFSIGIMLVLVLITFAVANIQAMFWTASDWMVSAVLPSVIVNLTNEEREDDRLNSLVRNNLLDQAAQLKADHMAENEYFAHYAPDGTSPWYWFEEVAYNYVKAGENLAVHFNDSGKVVDAWMDSPSHRANILNGEYTQIGVGTAKGEYKGSRTVFVVQLFGTPNTLPPVTNTVVSNVELSSTSSAPQLATAEQTDDILGEETAEVIIPQPEETEVEQTIVEPPTIEETYIEVTQDDGTTTLYSDTATTANDSVPVVAQTDGGGVPPAQISDSNVSSFAKSVTQPSVWLQMVYLVLAVVVVISLIISVVVEWRRQNPVQIAYAGSLLAVMAILFHVHTTLTSGVTII
jgi:hypothetical protein